MVIPIPSMSPPTVKITRSRTASARLKSNGQHSTKESLREIIRRADAGDCSKKKRNKKLAGVRHRRWSPDFFRSTDSFCWSDLPAKSPSDLLPGNLQLKTRLTPQAVYRRPTGALPAPYRRPTSVLPAPNRLPTGARPAPYRRLTGARPASEFDRSTIQIAPK